MPNLNRVMLMGNLTRDPELRHTPSNQAVVQIGIAVNRRWTNQQGQAQEEVTFIDCEAWGKTAETINQYLRKGRPIFIEGRLKLDQWQDKEGHNRSKLKVVVDNFQYIDSKGDNAGGAGGNAGGGDEYSQAAPRQSAPPRRPASSGNANGNVAPSRAPAPPPQDMDGPPPGDDDIPF